MREESHQGCALHDGLFAAILGGHCQLREVHQHFSHFVAPLSAPHVHNPVTITVLGQGL